MNPPGDQAQRVLQQMDEKIALWKESGDHRESFLRCYRMMTANMFQGVKGGTFHDTEWIERLIDHFADYYFDALGCYECQESVPKVWQEVHDATRSEKLYQLQYLLIGVNAHINYDLVLALYDLLHEEWPYLPTEIKRQRYEDYTKVNKVIASTIDKVQDEIIEPHDPAMALIDRAFGRLDEFLLSKLINNWRDNVWENAMRMIATAEASERELLRDEIERDVLRKTRLISIT